MNKHTITKVEGKYFLNTDGVQGEALTVKQPNGWDPTIFLPEAMVTTYNRKLINTITLDKKLEQGEFVLTVKAPSATPVRTGSGSPRAPKKADVEFLSGEEAEQFKALMEKIQQARKEAAKPVSLTPIEKARRAKERAEAALEALLKAQEAETPEEPEQEPEATPQEDAPKAAKAKAAKGKK